MMRQWGCCGGGWCSFQLNHRASHSLRMTPSAGINLGPVIASVGGLGVVVGLASQRLLMNAASAIALVRALMGLCTACTVSGPGQPAPAHDAASAIALVRVGMLCCAVSDPGLAAFPYMSWFAGWRCWGLRMRQARWWAWPHSTRS